MDFHSDYARAMQREKVRVAEKRHAILWAQAEYQFSLPRISRDVFHKSRQRGKIILALSLLQGVFKRGRGFRPR